MLRNYKGGANNREIFEHLVGEKIQAAFRDDAGHVYIVVDSGEAIVFGGVEDAAGPSFWKKDARDVRTVITAREDVIRLKLAELRDMAGVKLP